MVLVLRIVAEVQGALDYCAERQRQLERSLRVSRRLLQVWYADLGIFPGPPRNHAEPQGLGGQVQLHTLEAGCLCYPSLFCRV